MNTLARMGARDSKGFEPDTARKSKKIIYQDIDLLGWAGSERERRRKSIGCVMFS